MNSARDAQVERVEPLEPTLLIRIRQLYSSDLTPEELYDVVRGVWVLGPRRKNAKLAFAVVDGIVREVYVILDWHPAGSTAYIRRTIDLSRYRNRWEFTGSVAPEEVRNKYVGKSVAHYFRRGAANPIYYVNC